MTGKYWVERGEKDQQRTSRQETNSGRCERSCTICRSTNHKAIGADRVCCFKRNFKGAIEYIDTIF